MSHDLIILKMTNYYTIKSFFVNFLILTFI